MKRAEIGRNHLEVEKIFQQQAHGLRVHVDKAFVFLMLIQWIIGILLGVFVTPSTWIGPRSGALENASMGFIFGGFFTLVMIYCANNLPGRAFTRCFVAAMQMCFATLLIFLSGGRIETHFLIFISLAALAFYNDIVVLCIGLAVAILLHILLGVLLPVSLYGESPDSSWRWLEYAGWMTFEVVILTLGIRKNRQEFREMAWSKVQLEKAREEALRKSTLKSNFLSNMSHEIRTPLNSILGFSEILRDTHLDEEQKEYVGTIYRCSTSLMHLINDILDISKIENDLLQIDHHRFDFKELHQDIHKMFLVRCLEKGLNFELIMSDHLPTHLFGDSHRIRQVLMNLVGNAIKFTEQGKIRVEVDKDMKTGVYHWRVTDTGKGIHGDNLTKLFKTFYQEDPSISRKY